MQLTIRLQVDSERGLQDQLFEHSSSAASPTAA